MSRWRIAYITGAGSGIGRRLAELLMQEGVSVAAFDRNADELVQQQLAAFAERQAGVRCIYLQADVTDSARLADQVAVALLELGTPDLAINCAGVQIAKPFEELSGEEFERVVNINLLGSRNFAAAVLPNMQSGSQFSFVASLAGLVPAYCYAAYNASKFGVVGLAGALRLEYIARGVEVSVICPPEVETPLVVEERKTMTATGAKLKSTAGTLQLEPACDSILKQLKARKYLVIPGWRARMVARMSAWLPGTLRWFSERIVISGSK